MVIYVSKNILKGQKLNVKNIKIVRPNKSMNPKYYDKILGMKTKINLYLGDRIKIKNLKR